MPITVDFFNTTEESAQIMVTGQDKLKEIDVIDINKDKQRKHHNGYHTHTNS